MTYFLDTVETIPEGVGFAHFGPVHLFWLIGCVVFLVVLCLGYRSADAERRDRMRRGMSWAIIADEIFKMVMLTIGGRYLPTYLPLHLCSVNIFLIALHTRRPGPALDNFLYTVGIPGALAALLFPTWTELPPANFMHLHSFTVHILLMAYPIMLFAGGDIRPRAKYAHKCLGLLALLALLVTPVNLMFDTNFLFLMSADPGNPLYLFEQAFGDHRIGFVVLIPVILVIMYLPVELGRRIRTKA